MQTSRALRKNAVAGMLLCASPLAAIGPGQAIGVDSAAPNTATLRVMPLPAHVVKGDGSLSVDDGLVLVFHGFAEPRLERARERFYTTLARETGILKWKKAPEERLPFVVETRGPSEVIQRVGEDESYHLEVSPAGVVLRAANPLGVLRGLQTFLQAVHTTPQGFQVDAMTIDDAPRFPWRGLMIDSGRHFMPVQIVKQNLDAMEAVKLNVLHWHVSEDQGFRIESKVFPKLQGLGSDGQYYTQAQVSDVIAYARDRGIRVYPEFEMPSHANSLYVGYPELADGKGPYHLKRKFGEKWGRPRNASEDSSMNPTLESTYSFLDKFVQEMSALFPDQYWHMGGDGEDAMTEWATNPSVQSFMKAHGMKDTTALQLYFTGRLAKIISSHHKTPIGWDEVLQPETPKNVMIQSWRGLDSLASAARSGHKEILSWGYYLDLNEPASRHYAVDPLGKPVSDLTPEQQALVLGGETAMWTEYVSPETIDGRIWPRAAAVAERLWSSQNTRDVADMYARLPILSQYLWARGLPFQEDRARMYQRIVGTADVSSLNILASVVEPPKGFPREGDREYDVFTPLSHLADVIPAESDVARRFRELAGRIADRKATPLELEETRRELSLLRDNDVALQPILQSSAIAAELGPISKNVSQAATIGLAALQAIERHQPLKATPRADDVSALKALHASTAELTDAIIPGVEALLASAP